MPKLEIPFDQTMRPKPEIPLGHIVRPKLPRGPMPRSCVLVRARATDYAGRVQGTVRSFDETTRSGTVFLDDGSVLEFGTAAFDAGPLRLLRTGQRVNLGMSGGRVAYVTLSTFPVPGEFQNT
ncbi:hypothetical protein ACU635_12390 [[Actinomadura] parvosata]|uniref:hypothetical protein n=1 Tax=[Actinomadura] parvosata TaxID=1955412 RepID=UPI00406C45DB